MKWIVLAGAVGFVACEAFSAQKRDVLAFFKACRNGEAETVTAMLAETPALANEFLTQKEWNEYVKFRYEFNKANNADINAIDKHAKTALFYASCGTANPDSSIVELLKQAGAKL